MAATKGERLTEVFRRLAGKPAAASYEEARKLLADVLTGVEDELSGVPNNPATWRSDGRMYPPQDDNERRVKGSPKVRVFRTVAHRIFFRANGAMEIQDLQRKVAFRKAGADGGGVWE